MRERRSLLLQLASRIYRLCFRLTPHRFRERFGPESEDAFRHLLEDTLRSEGAGAAVTTAAAACGDLARVGLIERVSGWRTVFTGVTGDLAQSMRIYWREPILAIALALTLALVAGPAVAIFSALYHIVLAPLPYPDAGRLVVVIQQTPRGPNPYLPAAAVSDHRGVQAFATVGGIFPLGSTLLMNGQPERVSSFRTTAGLLSLLGVPFVAGRDLQRGAAEVVVTRGFAQARFGSEAAAVGQVINVNRQPLTIVGVLAYAPPLPGPPGGELFIPHQNADRSVAIRQRQGGQAIVIARLRPDSDVRVALQQAKAVAAAVRMQFGGEDVTTDLISLHTAVSGSLRGPLLILFVAVALVFLIAVTSLATLVLARAASRAADVAVRRSLGASGWRLTRSWLLDGAVLALPGLLLSVWLGDLLVRYGQSSLPPRTLPLPEIRALAPIAIGTIGMACATAALFTVAPIAAGLLRSPAVFLRDATRSVAGLRRVRSQSMLIVGQVAFSLVLVTSAVWLSTSLARLLSRPVGFEPAHLVAIQYRSAQPYDVQIDAARRVLPRLRQLVSDVDAGVAVSSSLLPGVNASVYVPTRIRPDQPAFSDEERPRLARAAVSADYFRVLGIPLLQGRYFTSDDDAIADRVVVVSRSFATRWFPEGPVGRTVSFEKNDRREVIGIVDDVHAGRLSEESVPQFYVPMSKSTLETPSSYIMRTSRPVESLRADVTSIVREIDPAASVAVMSAEDALALPLSFRRIANQLAIGMALLALLLAIVNVYALSSFAVIQRTREIGIRVALGASAADATRFVMRRGLVWIGVGLVIGAGLTRFVAAPMLERQLFQTKPDDPRLLALAFVMVTGVAVLASWLPARRAARIDPAITLRAE